MSPQHRAAWSRWRGIGRWCLGLYCAGGFVMARIFAQWIVGLATSRPSPLDYLSLMFSAALGFGIAQVIWHRNENLFAAAAERRPQDQPSTTPAL
jgi:hypothetical protein